MPNAPCTNINPNAVKVVVGTAGGAPHYSSAACDILLSQLPTTAGHSIPNSHHTMLGIGSLCDHDCRVLFDKSAGTVFSRHNTILIRGHRKTTGAKLWCFHLNPQNQNSLPQ